MVGYRIVEIVDGKVRSLFHGTNGSREIPIGEWYQANTKEVKDGTNGKIYKGGWHFLPTKEDAISFLDRMFRIKDNRYVIECYVRGDIREKAHSKKGGCLLANEIMITPEQVEEIYNV